MHVRIKKLTVCLSDCHVLLLLSFLVSCSQGITCMRLYLSITRPSFLISLLSGMPHVLMMSARHVRKDGKQEQELN